MKSGGVIARIVLVGAFAAIVGMGGCTKKPTQNEVAKLDEAKMSAESAEKKLEALRQERMQLEAALAQKQAELNKSEAQRDSLQPKPGK